jgi:hypothetical protein
MAAAAAAAEAKAQNADLYEFKRNIAENVVASIAASRRTTTAVNQATIPAAAAAGQPEPTNAAGLRVKAIRRGRGGAAAEGTERECAGYLSREGLPWTEGDHALCAPRLLTVDDPRAETPPGFKGRLFPPQATLLAAMVAFERNPVVVVDGAHSPHGRTAYIQTRFARISERFSFGKTVLSLALICAQRLPAAHPEISTLMSSFAHMAAFAPIPAGSGLNNPIRDQYLPEITVAARRVLPLTIVAAVAPVISQWVDNTRRFTTLRYHIVENVNSLRDLETLYRSGRIGDIDVLFLKAGRVTANFVVEGEPAPPSEGTSSDGAKLRGGVPKAKAKTRSLFEAVARIFEGVPVARLIIDDYDTLKLTPTDCFVPAHFTWLISATRRITNVGFDPVWVIAAPPPANSRKAAKGGASAAPAPTPAAACSTVAAILRANLIDSMPVLAAARDGTVNTVFSLHCDKDYVDAHLNSTAYRCRRIAVAGGAAAAMLRNLDVPPEVLEMLNAGAVGTAARALGLEAASAADVVRRVVGTHLGKLRAAVRALERVEDTAALLAERGGYEDDSEVVKELRAALKSGTDAEAAAAVAALAGGGKLVNAALASLREWATEERNAHGRALARMRDNIREGHCQCCMVPFDEDGGGLGSDSGDDAGPQGGAAPAREAAYVMAGCCQIIVCELCITHIDGATRTFIRRCPNCSKELGDPKTALVRVGADADLAAALDDSAVLDAMADEGGEPGAKADDNGDEHRGDEKASAGANAGANAVIAAIGDPKLKALLQFLCAPDVGAGAPTIDCKSNTIVASNIAGLLCGTRDSPWPATKPRKSLIFTMHSESTIRIEEALTECKIKHSALRGDRARKDAALAAVRDGDSNILLVTAPKDCGGLNMPFLSHVIFYHRVVDKNVEAQVAARGQRLGREHNLEIVSFLNDAELAAAGLPAADAAAAGGAAAAAGGAAPTTGGAAATP